MSFTPIRWFVVLALALPMFACSDDRATAPPLAASPWLAMARGQVDVDGGLIDIVTLRDGQVASVLVEAGDKVATGAVLATLDQRRAELAVSTAEAALAEATARVTVAGAALPQARLAVRRLEAAAAAGAASGQAAGEARTALSVHEGELAAARAAVAVASAQLDTARLERDAGLIRAPVAGRIVRRTVAVGETLFAQGGRPLFELLPDRPRIVRAELDEAWVDRVKPGMQASVVRDSGDGPAVGATVLRVGEVFGPSRLAEDPVERASAREVECILELAADADLRIGQRVLVRFPKAGH